MKLSAEGGQAKPDTANATGETRSSLLTSAFLTASVFHHLVFLVSHTTLAIMLQNFLAVFAGFKFLPLFQILQFRKALIAKRINFI
jgi:hypothetical protein